MTAWKEQARSVVPLVDEYSSNYTLKRLKMLQAGLNHPAVQVGRAVNASGCFAKADIDSGQLFGWESIMCFTLVSTVFAVASKHSILSAVKSAVLRLTNLFIFQAFTGCPQVL